MCASYNQKLKIFDMYKTISQSDKNDNTKS